jgi:hypothetical protein
MGLSQFETVGLRAQDANRMSGWRHGRRVVINCI